MLSKNGQSLTLLSRRRVLSLGTGAFVAGIIGSSPLGAENTGNSLLVEENPLKIIRKELSQYPWFSQVSELNFIGIYSQIVELLRREDIGFAETYQSLQMSYEANGQQNKDFLSLITQTKTKNILQRVRIGDDSILFVEKEDISKSQAGLFHSALIPVGGSLALGGILATLLLKLRKSSPDIGLEVEKLMESTPKISENFTEMKGFLRLLTDAANLYGEKKDQSAQQKLDAAKRLSEKIMSDVAEYTSLVTHINKLTHRLGIGDTAYFTEALLYNNDTILSLGATISDLRKKIDEFTQRIQRST